MMDRQLKQRVVGAAVLVLIGVIFIPLFLDQGTLETRVPEIAELPAQPREPYVSRVEPLDENDITVLEQAIEAPLEMPAEVSGPGLPEPVAEGAEGALADDAPVHGNSVDDDAASVPPPAPARTPPPAAPTGAGWSVQLGSFAEADNATRLVARLKEAHLPGYVERVEDDGASIWKVRVGPVVARDEADELRARLAREFGLEGLLLRYP
ncbi:MAG: SPOR domain-containing protein [Gammaproteobacteria bacterium]